MSDKNKIRCNFDKEHLHNFYSADPFQNTILDCFINLADNLDHKLASIHYDVQAITKDLKTINTKLDYIKDQNTKAIESNSLPRIESSKVQDLQNSIDKFTKKVDHLKTPDSSDLAEIKALTEQISSLSLDSSIRIPIIRGKPPKQYRFARFRDI